MDYEINNYTAKWLQFKTPSEHSIRNVHAPLEVQIYMENVNDPKKQPAMFSFLVYRPQPPGQEFKTNLTKNFFDNADFKADGTAGVKYCFARFRDNNALILSSECIDD